MEATGWSSNESVEDEDEEEEVEEEEDEEEEWWESPECFEPCEESDEVVPDDVSEEVSDSASFMFSTVTPSVRTARRRRSFFSRMRARRARRRSRSAGSMVPSSFSFSFSSPEEVDEDPAPSSFPRKYRASDSTNVDGRVGESVAMRNVARVADADTARDNSGGAGIPEAVAAAVAAEDGILDDDDDDEDDDDDTVVAVPYAYEAPLLSTMGVRSVDSSSPSAPTATVIRSPALESPRVRSAASPAELRDWARNPSRENSTPAGRRSAGWVTATPSPRVGASGARGFAAKASVLPRSNTGLPTIEGLARVAGGEADRVLPLSSMLGGPGGGDVPASAVRTRPSGVVLKDAPGPSGTTRPAAPKDPAREFGGEGDKEWGPGVGE